MLPSILVGLLLSVSYVNCNPLELMIILEISSAKIQDGIFEVGSLVNFEWNITQGKLPMVYVDQLLDEKKSLETKQELPENMMRVRYFGRFSSYCDGLDLTKYPWDTHTCQLRFLSTQNSSKVILLPHIVETPLKPGIGWTLEGSKSFVQWLQSGEQSYELAVFELTIRRVPGSLVAVFWLSFLLNVLAICNHFPFFNEVAQPSRHIGCWVVFVQALICLEMSFNSPSNIEWPNSVQGTFNFFVFSAVVCILASVIPPLVLHLHLVPFQAHPEPCDVPIPSEHYSLDSERTRLSAALDSARLDSSRTRRSENVDLCMAELKYTLASLNETMNAKSTAAWRRKLWISGYGRVETAIAVILHGANVILLLIAMY